MKDWSRGLLPPSIIPPGARKACWGGYTEGALCADKVLVAVRPHTKTYRSPDQSQDTRRKQSFEVDKIHKNVLKKVVL